MHTGAPSRNFNGVLGAWQSLANPAPPFDRQAWSSHGGRLAGVLLGAHHLGLPEAGGPRPGQYVALRAGPLDGPLSSADRRPGKRMPASRLWKRTGVRVGARPLCSVPPLRNHTHASELTRVATTLPRESPPPPLLQALLPSPTASPAHAINLASSEHLVLAAIDNQEPPQLCYATRAALDLWVRLQACCFARAGSACARQEEEGDGKLQCKRADKWHRGLAGPRLGWLCVVPVVRSGAGARRGLLQPWHLCFRPRRQFVLAGLQRRDGTPTRSRWLHLGGRLGLGRSQGGGHDRERPGGESWASLDDQTASGSIP